MKRSKALDMRVYIAPKAMFFDALFLLMCCLPFLCGDVTEKLLSTLNLRDAHPTEYYSASLSIYRTGNPTKLR